jgi:hypothetical protein
MSDIADLKRLCGLILDAELAGLREVSAELDEVTGLADSLRKTRGKILACSANEQSAGLARCLGRDLAWLEWHRAKQTKLSLKRAEVASRREEQAVRARNALGRVHALDALDQKIRSEVLSIRARRERGESW